MAFFALNHQVQVYFGEQALANNPLDVHSLEHALELAKRQDKKVLVNMSAIWCTACRQLDQQVFIQSDVRGFIQQHFIYARVEYESEQGKAFSVKYRVLGFPNILIIDAGGEVVAKVPMKYEPGAFLANLKSAMQTEKPI